MDLDAFIHVIPKAELHIHIEGALEPPLMFELAAKNNIRLPYESVAEIYRAYDFADLQSFLDIYYQGSQVLLTENDFYQLTWNYLQKAAEQNVRHTEIFFDPQAHTLRGVKFDVVLQGIHRACTDARRRLNLSAKLIMCFLRDRRVAEAGCPPDKFTSVFDLARRQGFAAVAHAGEEGPPEYIWQALRLLKVDRIDHGVRCLEDAALVRYLAKRQVPLTVCPLSNVKLRVFEDLAQHNLKRLLQLGLCVTVNSDDPAYFGGYIEENFRAIAQAQKLDFQDIYRLAHNAFQASFLGQAEKQNCLNELDAFMSGAGVT
jgi:adenosine deaminase